jgi:hypothetical protein
MPITETSLKPVLIPVRVTQNSNNQILLECDKLGFNRSEFVRFLIHTYFTSKSESL